MPIFDFDLLEERIADFPLPRVGDSKMITAHYYVQAEHDLKAVAAKVASHQSTAASVYSRKNLLDRCSARVDGVTYLKGKKEGIVQISFPLELFGERIFSGDILHIVSGAVQNDESQHHIFYLIDIEIPTAVIKTFPGPAFGPRLFSAIRGPRIGTIIKPCSGITVKDYERIVAALVALPELQFIKEDENLFPGFTPCPLAKRVAITARLIKQSGRVIIFAPHITAPPRQLLKNIEIVAQAGLPAVMFSETYYGGMFREARDFIRERGLNLAIYGHNGGIAIKTKNINRLVLDRLARLDGIDLRQTAPSGENCYLRPLPWQRDRDEAELTKPTRGINKTICVRAGGLDQGNLLQNLYEAEHNFSQYLFLMGSAINSVKNKAGEYDPAVGVAAIRDILTLYRGGIRIKNVRQLMSYASKNGLSNLTTVLRQRYPQLT